MKANDEITDALISKSIKELGLDEPSADFTSNIMQAVSAQPAIAPKQDQYWWWLSVIPVMGVIAWFVLYGSMLTGYISQFWESLGSLVHPYIQAVTSFPEHVKNMKVSPLLLAGFLAIVVLLTIEELQRKAKHTPS